MFNIPTSVHHLGAFNKEKKSVTIPVHGLSIMSWSQHLGCNLLYHRRLGEYGARHSTERHRQTTVVPITARIVRANLPN